MTDKKDHQLFVERRQQGDYAIRRAGSERAADTVEATQKEAIARAKELEPKSTPMVERVWRIKVGSWPQVFRQFHANMHTLML